MSKREQRAERILSCTNIAFVVFATLSIAVNEVCALTSFGDEAAKLRIFYILPYLVLVSILIFSICRIKQLVRRYDLFQARDNLMAFMMLCFITFALNWLFILPVSAFYEHFDSNEETVKEDKVEFVFFILCMLFELLSTVLLLFIVYMLYQMQNKVDL